MNAIMISKALVFCALFLFAQGASAVVFEVTTVEEFQAALSVAASNSGDDEIFLASGTYVGNFKYNAREAYDLVVTSKDPRSPAIIDANRNNFGLLIQGNDQTFDLVLGNLKIVNAETATKGAAVILRDIMGKAKLSELRVEDSIAEEGSALWANNIVSLELTDSRFLRNSGNNSTGGIVSIQNTIEASIIGTTIGGNADQVMRSGAISFEQVWHAVFDSNEVSGYGDPSQFAQYLLTIRLANQSNFSDSLRELAVDLDRKSMVVKQNALFPLAKSGSLYLSAQSEDDSSIVVIDNSIEGDCSGGFEIAGELGEVRVTRNTFIDRSSCARFYLWVSGDSAGSNEIILENNLFKGYHLNTGTYAPYSLRFTNNTFINFSQTNVFQPSSESELRISNNVFYSENIAEGLELVTLPKFASLKNNVFENSKGFWDVNEENILVAPLFADFNQGDFRFRESGVGIDAGSNGAIADIDGTDLDGNPRIVNGVVDIGAYERFTGALHPADTNGDQSISQVEFDTYNAAWRTNEAWPTLPSIIPVDFVTRAGYLLQKGGAYKNIGVGKPATWVPEDE